MACHSVDRGEARRLLGHLDTGHKTPVSIVMELAANMGKEVSFDESNELAWSPNAFKFNARLGDICTVGHGRNKKEAKHNSAQEILNIIRDSEPDASTNSPASPGNGDASPSLKYSTPSPSPSLNSTTDSPSTVNSVGELQNLAAKNRWKLPDYDFDEPVGEPHRKTFTCVVKMSDRCLECTGSGSSKKSAKKRAAEKMLQLLQGDTVDSGNIQDHTPVLTRNNQESSPDSSILDFSDLEDYNPSISDSPPPDMNTYEEDITDDLAVQKLQSKSEEEKFNIAYIHLPSKSKKGLYQVFVKLEFRKSGGIEKPPIVTHGTGETKNLACCRGAHRALKHLEIMMSLP